MSSSSLSFADAAKTSVFADAMLQRQAVTENGAPSLATTQPMDIGLDDEKVGARMNLFTKLERSVDDAQLKRLVDLSWAEDSLHTMILLFNARDRDGGKGEREIFRKSITHLVATGRGDSVAKNVALVPYFGRWDDVLWCPTGDELMAEQLLDDFMVSHCCANGLPKPDVRTSVYVPPVEEKKKHDGSDVVNTVDEDFVDVSSADSSGPPPKRTKRTPLDIATDTKADTKTTVHPKRLRPVISLAAKWAPSVGKSLDKKYGFGKAMIKALAKVYGKEPQRWSLVASALANLSKAGRQTSRPVFNAEMYRRLCGVLREDSVVLERLMCQDRWDEVDLNTVPSCAMHRLRKALKKHLGDRFDSWAAGLKTGVDATTGEKVKVNARQLFCHEIVSGIRRRLGLKWGNGRYSMTSTGVNDASDDDASENALANAQWVELEKKLDETASLQDVLCVADVSGSMESELPKSTVTCMDVSMSLAILMASRCKGPFKDTFMTFSSSPCLQKLVGEDLVAKLKTMQGFDSGLNTDLLATFEKILDVATRARIPQSEMPKMVVVVSDMQWDNCGSSTFETNFELIQRKFSESKYEMPALVFWNVRTSGNEEYPVTANECNTALVSGFSTNILKQVLSGKLSPWDVVLRVLEDPRYRDVQV
jgi:hypothetical protein